MMLKALWQFIRDCTDALTEDDGERIRREQNEAEATRRRDQDWLRYRSP